MKIVGNTLETLHNFRHKHIASRILEDPFLATKVALALRPNVKLQLLYLDVNETFYLVESTTSMAHSLIYNDGAIVVHEWSPIDVVALKQSYDKPGFDNYFQMLINNTAQAIVDQQNVQKA